MYRKMNIEDLQEMQKWPLEQKVFHTITTIQTFMSRMDDIRGRRVTSMKQRSKGYYISFSGGKDSTVLLDIARRFIDSEFPAVFCNTGTEYPEIIEFVKSLPNIHIIHPKTSFKRVCEKYGFPLVSKYVSYAIHRVKHSNSKGEIDRYLGNDKNYSIPLKYRFLIHHRFECNDICCEKLKKKKPFNEYEREFCRLPIIGTTCQESNQRKLNWVKDGGCNYYQGNRPMSKPMSIWLEKDIWEYIRKVNIPISKIYDQLPDSQKRTGCMVCGFNLNGLRDRLDIIKKKYPKLYDFYMNIENNGITYEKALNCVMYLD